MSNVEAEKALSKLDSVFLFGLSLKIWPNAWWEGSLQTKDPSLLCVGPQAHGDQLICMEFRGPTPHTLFFFLSILKGSQEPGIYKPDLWHVSQGTLSFGLVYLPRTKNLLVLYCPCFPCLTTRPSTAPGCLALPSHH